jgi:hypothetical protein
MCRPPHTSATVTVAAGQTSLTAFVSARFTSIDSDVFAHPGADPVGQAAAAYASATTTMTAADLWARHANAMADLNRARIEIGGNLALARAINASFHALHATVCCFSFLFFSFLFFSFLFFFVYFAS